ncbi:MAG: hypothetical protein IBX57_00730 [Gammaproteobacteria bacterium]|nr:hypothetical protein [Gammaproteobacteria bacterium]
MAIGIKWQDLYQRGMVFGSDDYGSHPLGTDTIQDARINIDGSVFRVRLLKGLRPDNPYDYSTSAGYHPESTWGSEWNNLLYPLHNGIHFNSGNNVANHLMNIFDELTEAEMKLRNNNWTFCQEAISVGSTMRCVRGYYGITYKNNSYGTIGNTYASYGYQPCFELIQ